MGRQEQRGVLGLFGVFSILFSLWLKFMCYCLILLAVDFRLHVWSSGYANVILSERSVLVGLGVLEVWGGGQLLLKQQGYRKYFWIALLQNQNTSKGKDLVLATLLLLIDTKKNCIRLWKKNMSKLMQAYMCIGLGKLRTKVVGFFFSFKQRAENWFLAGYIKNGNFFCVLRFLLTTWPMKWSRG